MKPISFKTVWVWTALSLSFLLVSVPVRADRVKDLVDVAGVRENQLIGYGLVVGLSGTGDGKNIMNRFTSQSLRSMLVRFGVNIKGPLNDYDETPPFQQDQLDNIAAVMVTADMPAFAKPGQRIDVTVGSIGLATSLRGGSLLLTRLRGADGEVYALAQGSLAVGGLGASAQGSKIIVNVPTTGRIPSGATVERMVRSPFMDSEYVVLNTKQKDFTTINRIVNAINLRMGEGTAESLDGVSARVRAPDGIGQRVGFMSMIENIDIVPGEGSARVVVNSRTGTVVISRNVRVTAAAVSHGNLILNISQTNKVIQTNPLATGGTTQTQQNATIEIEEENKRMVLFNPGVELREVVDAVNRVGAAPSALVAILETLRQSGSLRAELIII